MFSCAFRCVKWGGGMDGRCMEVKGQPQVWVHLETGFLSFGFLGDFPNSTSQLLSRALDVALWHSLHIYMGSENSHSDAYASAARTFPTEPPSPAGNANRKHRALPYYLVPVFISEGRTTRPTLLWNERRSHNGSKPNWQRVHSSHSLATLSVSILHAHLTSNEHVCTTS